jgi:Fibronectin type III-like domain
MLRSRQPFTEASVTVTNTSQRAGAEIVELYATRCWFQPGQEQSVTIPINQQNLRRWDDPTHQYIIDPGTYGIYARSSSDTPDTQSASGQLTLTR